MNGLMEIKYRPASSEDLSELSMLEQLCFGDPWSEALLREEIEGKEPGAFPRLWLAEDGVGNIAAYCSLRLQAGEAEIYRIAVRPEARRRGLGRMFLEALLAEAAKGGARRCLLEVREHNAGARSFYKALGFAESGRRRNYYREPKEDAILLDKPLG